MTERGRRLGLAAAAATAAAVAVAGLATLGAPLLAAALGFVAVFAASLAVMRRQRARLRRIAESAGVELAEVSGEPRAADRLAGLEGTLSQVAASARATSSELAMERAWLSLVLENVSDGLLAVDRSGQVALANAASLELLGIADSPVGRSLAECVRVPALHELVAEACDGGGSAELELPNLRRIDARCTRLEGGGALVVLRDVTALRRLETVRRDFVANVSHELRTPLTVIRANGETLLELGAEDPEASRSLAEAIARQAERMSHIVNELLDLSRLEGGGYPLETEALAVAPVIERAAELVAHNAAARGTAVSTDLEPVEALADEAALERIVSNLLDNAVKHTPPRSSVTVRARRARGEVVIEVEDDGPGIELRHLPRIFERFYRADDGRSRSAGGTGLGLSIAKHLAELMGGSVSVAVGRSRGALFTVTLPARPAPS